MDIQWAARDQVATAGDFLLTWGTVPHLNPVWQFGRRRIYQVEAKGNKFHCPAPMAVK